MSQATLDNLEPIMHKMKRLATNPEQTRHVIELPTLINLRPYAGPDKLLCAEGRLENADLPTDTKHPIILPGRHPLTRPVMLSVHPKAGNAGPA